MESISPEINAIHHAWCEAIGYEVRLMPNMERGWRDALKYGMTDNCVKIVIKHRQNRIKTGVRHPECLMFRNVAGSEDAISSVLEEAAAIRATMRIKVYPTGKAQALRATGRSDAPEQGPARPIGEVIQAMRQAVG